MGLPSVHDESSPANRGLAGAGLIAAIVLVPTVMFFQWFLRDLRGATLATPTVELARNEDVYDPGVGELTVASKMAVKAAAFLRAHTDLEPDEEDAPDAILSELDQIAETRTDRMRVAIVAGELKGAVAAVTRIDELRKEVTPGGELDADLAWLREWYASVAVGRGVALASEVQESLVSRHGWFAQLALSIGQGDADAYRASLVGGYAGIIGYRLILFVGGALVSILGVVLGAVWIVRVNSSREEMTLPDPSAPTSVYLETFAVFLGVFVLLLALDVLFIGGASATGAVLSILLLWAAGAAAVWPVLRGVSWSDWRHDIGLHRGQGLAKEIACGVFGYLAALPLTIAGSMIALLIQKLVETEKPRGFPLFDQPGSASWVALFVGVLSACVWAPLVEETMFRGCLYSRLRTRLSVVLAVLVSATVFGAIHPYSPSGMVAVGFGGVAFAVLREWRGSLVAPMTAHFLHNATISLTGIVFLAMLG